VIQRFLDITFSLLALICLLPFLLPIALALKFTGEGEILFSQKRVGKNGKLFNLFKFATMLKNSPNLGSGTVTLKDDPRVLPFGGFLRKTKINELSQLINIFIGDMSVVGPRPQTPRCFEVFPIEFQQRIKSVRPGLSGLGPIIFRDEENILSENIESIEFYDQVIAPYKGQVESYYTSVNSVVTYFKVILLTVWVVFFPNSSAVWKAFPQLPKPPNDLMRSLHYPKV